MEGTKVIDEKNKIYFKKGDVVRVKGIETYQPDLKVERVVFETDKDGNFIYKNGSKIIKGVECYWFDKIVNSFGEEQIIKQTMIFDSRSLYLVNHSINYYLHEAKKIAIEKNNNDLVALINKCLDLV